MGIRCIGYEVVCDTCGAKLGPFATFEDAEKALSDANWAYWLPSFKTECQQCKIEKSEAAR